MALSSEWSSSVVVRADRGGGEVVSQQMPTNSSARAYAASGNPIVVRTRDPSVFTSSGGGGSSTTSGGEASSSTASRALVTALVGRDISETFWIPDASKNEMGLLETLHRRGASNRTYVLLQSRPLPELEFNFSTCTGMNIDLSHNAFRLSKTAMALQSMDAQLGPDDDGYDVDYEQYEQFIDDQTGEVFYQAEDGNFYPVEGGRSGGRRKRRGPQAGGSGSRINMSTKGFKTVMRASLQSLQEEDYYMVKYRDYSAWATSMYRSIAKSDTIFGRKYVEQCFAVHVGREPGELIPITEAQFLFGVDILQRQLLNQLDKAQGSMTGAGATTGRAGTSGANKQSYMQYQVDINYSALNADQFRALGALLGDGLRPVGVEYEEKKKAEEEARARERGHHAGRDLYEAPAWYDWTPGAVRRRVRHQLETYYTSVGRLVVQVAVIGIVGYFSYRAVKDYIPSLGGGSDGDGDRGGRKGRGDGGSSRKGRNGNYYNDGPDRPRRRKSYFFADEGDDEGYEYVKRGFLRTVLMGPREVLDYILAPTSDE